MTEKPKVYSRYYEQWNILLKQMLTFTKSEMKTFAAQGNLRGNSFRSIYWRVFLECFPTNFKHWSAALEKSRQTYTSLHKEVILGDPRSAQNSGDLQIDNPLSLHEKSTWRIYFSNQELLSKIRQDVTRTYPELKFFTSERIRRIMTELLFIYALQYPHISYKQGMHEILGLIIYAFSFDFEAFKNAEENGALNGLFAALMQIVQPFYFQDEDGRCKTKKQLNDIASKCPLMVKLQGVTDSLKHVDFPLYNHLQCLDIPVEVYGIRWFRLLFGREFFIEDLFVIWDIIFADGPPYSIIECFSVAMLCYISDILLRSDYMGCLKILMKYPSVEDIFQLISIAVFLQTRIDDYLHSSAFARHVDVVCSRPAESNKTLRKSYLPFSFNIFPRKKNSDSASTSSSSLAEKLKKRYQRQSDDAVVNRRPIFPSNRANSSKSSRSSASSSSECVTSTEEILVKEKIRQLQAGIMLNASKQLDDYADYLDQVTREGAVVADTGALVNISAGLRNVSALLRDNFSSPARRHNRPPMPRAQHPRPRIVETPNMRSMDFAIEMGQESIPVDEAFQIDETFLSTRLKRENELVELRRNQS
ncbi:TBC1 domain family member 5 [Trichinella nelsoni]|uniref:TBC1 domain family member 5 n=1 Tax=Trichinella nelsoni TaxID=6336 RepID=A0A0V0SCQ7_9BILA|nr:TBC1 domain family member 5 [Trichinella nelsoni]